MQMILPVQFVSRRARQNLEGCLTKLRRMSVTDGFWSQLLSYNKICSAGPGFQGACTSAWGSRIFLLSSTNPSLGMKRLSPEVCAKHRNQFPTKLLPVAMPPSRIWKLEVRPRPIRVPLSSPHVDSDGSNHGDDSLWTQLANSSTQASFACKANAQPRSPVHPVYRPAAKINEVTTQRSKGIQKLRTAHTRKRGEEGISCGPVES